jgi:hypothetical protein
MTHGQPFVGTVSTIVSLCCSILVVFMYLPSSNAYSNEYSNTCFYYHDEHMK